VARKDASLDALRHDLSSVFLRGFIGLSLAVLLFSSQSVAGLEAKENSATTHPIPQITGIVDGFCSRLGMPHNVQVSVVESNHRMVSVEHFSGTGETFLLSFDAQFLNGLTDDEVAAAVAHELGHVWIFSHHPYLQTEALANEIAMRVVSRESLKTIYAKLWAHLGSPSDLSEFFGSENNTN